MTQVISSVLHRIANRKRSMVAHHDSLKLSSDRDLPIWLLRKQHELKGKMLVIGSYKRRLMLWETLMNMGMVTI